MTVFPIQAYQDNYIWCIHDAESAVVVDPGDASPVVKYLTANGLKLCAILVTHHHWDHTDGIDDLLMSYQNIPVYGPNNPKIYQVNRCVSEGNRIDLCELNLCFRIVEVPGHTLDHIAYYNDDWVFCGDTVFSAGCGRLFEGSAGQMVTSIAKLMALPNNTELYCTHEYTLANLKFANCVEPNSQVLQDYTHWAKLRRQNDEPTLPSTIAQQAQINPFVRLHSPEIIDSLKTQGYLDLDTYEQRFAALRHWKDNF